MKNSCPPSVVEIFLVSATLGEPCSRSLRLGLRRFERTGGCEQRPACRCVGWRQCTRLLCMAGYKRPPALLHVQCIEDCEERFSEQQIEELLALVDSHLGAAA